LELGYGCVEEQSRGSIHRRNSRGEPSCTNIQLSAKTASLTEVSGRLLTRFDGLDDRRFGDQDDRDCLEVIRSLLTSTRAVLLEHFAAMPIQVKALLGAKLAYVERKLDVPVMQDDRIEVLGHQQIAFVRERDVSTLKKMGNVG
jgi:hypothetical protein